VGAAEAFHGLIREAYHYRNPFTTEGRQQRYWAALGAQGEMLQSSWKSTARGHVMMAISGMGKSTFANTAMMDFPPLIRHLEHQGRPFKVYQIPIITLRIPHDGTIRSLCIQFFEYVDQRLKTNFAQDARERVSIGPMVDLMKEVATAVSLGLLIVDEVQNLRTARSNQAEFVLNLFTEIIEKVGISILVIATPALDPIINYSVRNTRKLVSGGCTLIPPMAAHGDYRWEMFTETLWDYQYVREKRALTPEIRKKWHECSGGNSAFAALVFYMAQRAEIDGREYLDASSFEQAYATNLSFLHPAILALRSGNPAQLRLFDDLMVSERWVSMRKSMGVKEPPKPVAPSAVPEFIDLKKLSDGGSTPVDVASSAVTSNAPVAPKPPRTAAPASLPTEDPFANSW
jgi:hypothetical protein